MSRKLADLSNGTFGTMPSYLAASETVPSAPSLRVVEGRGEDIVSVNLTAEEAFELFQRALNSQFDDSPASASAMRKLAMVIESSGLD